MPSAGFLAPFLIDDGPRPLQVVGGAILAANAYLASTSASRRRGLLGRERLPPDEALVIAPCNAIHMFFMRFAIDLVWVARDGRVLAVREHVPPWRIAICWRAFAAIELAAGAVQATGVRAGDVVAVV